MSTARAAMGSRRTLMSSLTTSGRPEAGTPAPTQHSPLVHRDRVAPLPRLSLGRARPARVRLRGEGHRAGRVALRPAPAGWRSSHPTRWYVTSDCCLHTLGNRVHAPRSGPEKVDRRGRPRTLSGGDQAPSSLAVSGPVGL